MTAARRKILCIEDDPETVELLVEVLEDEGFDTIVARDGHEGIARLHICSSDSPAHLRTSASRWNSRKVVSSSRSLDSAVSE